MNEKVGVDIGYAFTKLISSASQTPVIFPSATGTPDRSRFSFDGASNMCIKIDDEEFFVGDSALMFSRFSTRDEGRGWTKTSRWRALLYAAFSQMTAQNSTNVSLVTGLPISYFEDDKDELIDILSGEHNIEREGRPNQKVVVDRAIIIPQGMGVAVDVALTDDGKNIADGEVAEGLVGIIDIGGKTTNFQLVSQMNDVNPQTATLDLGSWDVVRACSEDIHNRCQDANYSDHELARAIAAGQIKYKGSNVDVRDIIANAVDDMCDPIIQQAAAIWDSFTKLDAVIIAGGGATVFGDALMEKIPFSGVRVAHEPMLSNVRGYYKLALRT